MELKNARLWSPHSIFSTFWNSCAAVITAFAVRYYLHDWIEPYAPFHFFIIACIWVAIRYGYKAALLSLLVCYLLGGYFFIKPYQVVGVISKADFIQAFIFFFVTAVAIGVIEKLQRTIYSQKLLIQVMHDQQRSMLYQRNEVEHKLRQLKAQSSPETGSSRAEA